MNKPLSNGVLGVISDALEVAEPDLLSRVEAQTDAVVADSVRSTRSGVAIGIYQGRNDAGEALVDFPLNPAGAAVVARAAVPLGVEDLGREIVLVFDSGEVSRPIILGLVQPPGAAEAQQVTSRTTDVLVDGQRVTIEAEKEVVIKCGEASITLTRAGKILIRGTYLLSRSSGANRIKGASIEMN